MGDKLVVHRYVALKKIHVRFPDGHEEDVKAGDMIPTEVTDSWSASIIRAMLSPNVRHIDYAGIDARSAHDGKARSMEKPEAIVPAHVAKKANDKRKAEKAAARQPRAQL